MFIPTIFDVGNLLYCKNDTYDATGRREIQRGYSVTVTNITYESGVVYLEFAEYRGKYDKSNFELAAQADYRASIGGQRFL